MDNATTYFDRTNYFETLPSHQLDLALWLEADRMATLLDALDQENLDNQREVVKNEKRQTYDNRPYGSFYEKLMAKPTFASHLSLLDRGQGAVVKMIDEMLPRLDDQEIVRELEEMREVHVVNIRRCAEVNAPSA